jgi:myo-inositol 2-dehydrogenase/D-chiro-inositol 1-dehydrogenase
VAAADLDKDLLERVADRFAIPSRYTNVEALLMDQSVDAVAVLVPVAAHVDVAIAVLNAGKHLFLEKPLALSLDEGNRLVQHAKKSSCTVMQGYNLRWHRLVLEGVVTISQGRLGDIKILRSAFTMVKRPLIERPGWRDRPELGGGLLYENAAHHVDLWRFLLQCEVDEVFTVTRSEEADNDVAILTARMTNGAIVSSSIAEKTGSEQSIGVFGSEGHLEIDLYRFDGFHFFPVSSRPGDLRTRLQGITKTLRELPRALLRGGRNDYDDSFQRMWSHFIDCVWQDGMPACTLTDGLRALEVIHAAAQSLAERKPVKIASDARGPTGR